jgi:nitrite reductase/ring-hydroxylating ferredoxin subunit
MERKDFIKTSCIACMGMALGATLLQSCVGTKYAKGTRNENGILLDLKEFETEKKEQRPYVIVRHDDLTFPVCVYRLGDDKYSALLMQCTHQGVELQASGDQLTCPAHGSAFDKMGKVTQSPAGKPLRTFPVTIVNGQLFIDLRKQA